MFGASPDYRGERAMIFRIDKKTKSIETVRSSWHPKELEIERYLLSGLDEDERILESSVFGEPFLLVSKQVRTRQKKRADILALDQAGNAVIIEIKRDSGTLGVETQALQYLADFSSYKGREFVARFSRYLASLEDHIQGFVGGNIRIEDINRHSRIILVARNFDPALYSMGEWLSTSGVAFRCIEYTPFEIEGEQFLSFSIAFDRSPEPLYPLSFQSQAREPGYFWHNIGHASNDWWAFLMRRGQISTGFDNQPGDQGERILKGYVSGDKVVAYAKGYGAIGWGVIEKPHSYKLLNPGDRDDRLDGRHLHRLSVVWKTVAPKLEQGIRPEVLREDFGIFHPLSTSMRIFHPPQPNRHWCALQAVVR
jgi:hypothetical protein